MLKKAFLFQKNKKPPMKQVRFSSVVSTREYTPYHPRRSVRLRPKSIAAANLRRRLLHSCEAEIRAEKNGMDEMCNDELKRQEREMRESLRNQQLSEHEIAERLAEFTQSAKGRMDKAFDRWATSHRRKCDKGV
jgi:hypothetical protein